MEPESAQALKDIIETAEPIFKNTGEFTTGGLTGSAVYAAGRSALTNDTISEAATSIDTATAGIISGLATAAANPIDTHYVENTMEYVGASVTGAGIGAVGGPIVRSWGEREPFYENWADKARENIVKGAVALPAAYAIAEYIQTL